MALTYPLDTRRQPGEIVTYRTATNATIFRGALICVDTATGLAVPGTDSANRIFVGVAVEPATNGQLLRVEKRGVHSFPLAAGATPAQTDIGRAVFLKDDGSVAFDTQNDIPCGHVVGVDGADVRVRIDQAVR